MFYALMSQLPGYDARYREVIKEGILNDFLTRHYGERHNRSLRISELSDIEYCELIRDMRNQISECKSAAALQGEAVRKRLIHQILTALSRIGVAVVNGDYAGVNYHISRLPVSKGRTIPRIPTGELPNLLGAVRAYCDVIRKKQKAEKYLAARN